MKQYLIKQLLFISTILLIFLSYSCSDDKSYTVHVSNEGKKTYLNKNSPSNQDLKIILNKKFEICEFDSTDIDGANSFISMQNADEDKDGNIFILGTNGKGLIQKYDSKGKFIKSFSIRGQGPGEAVYYQKILILNDTISALANNMRMINKFDLNGNFLSSIKIDNFYRDVYKLSDNRIAGIIWHEKKSHDDQSRVIVKVLLLNNNFKEIEVIAEKEIVQKGRISVYSKCYPYICGDNNNLYISWLSEEKYLINVYDTKNGEHKYDIKKKNRIKYYNDAEMDHLSKVNKLDMKKKFGKLKKRAINTIHCDKYGRLWVLATKERKDNEMAILFADIFDKGVYQKTVSFPEILFIDGTFSFVWYNINFAGNNIYYSNFNFHDEKKGRVIEVFDY